MNSLIRFIADVLDLPGMSVAGGSGQRERGSGNLVREERDVHDFTEVELHQIGNLIITQGDEEKLVIEAEDNILPHIETTVSGGCLIITRQHLLFDWMHPTLPITFYLSVKELNRAKLSGSGAIECDHLKSDRFRLDISGSGKTKFGELAADSLEINVSGSGAGRFGNVSVDEIETRISGSGDLTVAGQVTSQEIRISGAGKYDAEELSSEAADVDITGAGDARLRVARELRVSITGSGSVRYHGSPAVQKRISGSGRIRQVEG